MLRRKKRVVGGRRGGRRDEQRAVALTARRCHLCSRRPRWRRRPFRLARLEGGELRSLCLATPRTTLVAFFQPGNHLGPLLYYN